MEENKMEMVNEVVDMTELVEEVTETVAESKGGLLGKILTCLAVGSVCAVSTVLFKNRDKIKEKKLEKQIAKLEKHGYVVVKESEIDNVIVSELDDLEKEESEE